MKMLLTFLLVFLVATAAWGQKPAGVMNGSDTRVECSFNSVAWVWDFAQGDQGFTTGQCDTEGLPLWEWGTESVEFPAMNVWGTVLNGSYVSEAGESLISPWWLVDASNYLVQLVHYYDIETSYDGGNLLVNGVVVPPMNGYPDDELSDSTSFYAWCVDGQPGFTGHDPVDFFASCFDLTEFVGQEVQLEFQFGTDSSVTYPGWYFASITVGSDVVATEQTTWSAIKATFD